jgi:pyrroline-5-carboxylate reductase
MRIAFIGGGNMATSLIGGLRARGATPGDITVADPAPAQLERLQREFGVRVAADNAAAAGDADLVVLAVKPQEMAAVARGLAATFAERRRVAVSVAAGIRLASLADWLGGAPAVVRAMPNRPALIGAGVTAAIAAPGVEPREREAAAAVLSAVGPLVWLEDESQMDAVTAVSGSGPAYFFLLIEAIEDAGTSLGLPRETARLLAVHTALGAGRMATESGELPAQLREQVTSKGGTTAAALAVLDSADFRGLVQRAIMAAARRSTELARDFGKG